VTSSRCYNIKRRHIAGLPRRVGGRKGFLRRKGRLDFYFMLDSAGPQAIVQERRSLNAGKAFSNHARIARFVVEILA